MKLNLEPFNKIYVVIIFFMSYYFISCCKSDNIDVCDYNSKEVRFYNNSPKKIEIRVTYFNVQKSFVETLLPFQGKYYNDNFKLSSNSSIYVYNDNQIDTSFLIEPCEKVIKIIYDD